MSYSFELTSIPLHPFFHQEHIVKYSEYLHRKEKPCIKSYYLTQEQASCYRVDLDDYGRVTSQGRLPEDGWYMLVVDTRLTFYADIYLNSNMPRVRNHPNFIAGEAVYFSGYMRVFEGVIEELTNESGHYKLSLSQSIPFMHWFMNTYHLEVLIFHDYSTLQDKGSIAQYEINYDDQAIGVKRIILTERTLQPNCAQGDYDDLGGAQIFSRYHTTSAFFRSRQNKCCSQHDDKSLMSFKKV